MFRNLAESSKILRSIILPIILIFQWANANAQFKNISRITNEDGLSQGMIFDITQTRDGFMWFGTKNGLNRFDGHQFKIYTHNQLDSTSISGSIVTSIHEDRQGMLWVGSRSSGLNILDRNSGEFHTLTNEFLDASATIWSITEDSDGSIWITSFPNRITKVNGKDLIKHGREFYKNWDNIRCQSISIKEVNTKSDLNNIDINILFTKSGDLIVASPVGLLAMDKFQLNYEILDLPYPKNEPNIYAIFQDEYENIWAGCRGGVLIKKSNFWQFLKIGQKRYKNRFNSMISGKIFSNHYLDSYLIDPETLDITDIQNLKGNVITKLYRDLSGSYWMGTNGRGLIKLNISKNAFDNHLIGESTYLMYHDRKGDFWVQSPFGYSKYDLVNKQTANKKEAIKRKQGLISFVIQDKYNRYWNFNNSGKGSKLIINLEKGSVDKVHNLKVKLNRHSKGIIDGSILWVSGKNGGLSKIGIDNQKEILYHYNHLFDDDSDGLFSNSIVKSTTADCIWIGTNKGLVKASLVNGEPVFKIYHQAYIHHIIEDKSNPERYIWLGTKGQGLIKFDFINKVVVTYNKDTGLIDNEVYAMAIEDDNDHIWFSTNKGISKIRFDDLHLSHYTKDDGLQSTEYNSGAVYKDKNGFLYFGGTEGITRFHPNDVFESSYDPHNTIIDIKINGEAQPFSDDNNHIKLPYNKNVLSFEYATLDFTSPDKINYKYRLLGLSKDWIEIGHNRSLTFGPMNTGSYVFQVLGTNSSGLWSSKPAEYHFTIRPPWWRSMLAMLIYTGFFVASIYWFYRMQVKKLNLRGELAFNKREAQRLKEMNEMKTNFFSNITHELRTPLTLIIEPTKQLLKKVNDTTSKKELKLIKSNSMRILSLVNSLLDLAKIESKLMKPVWKIGDVQEHFNSILESFSSQAENKGILLTSECNLQEENIIYEEEFFTKILTNLISNAIKYTQQGYVKVTLDKKIIDDNNAVLSIIVEDSGQGISKDNLNRIFERFEQGETNVLAKKQGTGIGLALVKELTHLLEGEVEVSSELNVGSKFSVNIPWKVYADNLEISLTGSPQKEKFEISDNIIVDDFTQNPDDLPLLLIIDDNDELRAFLNISLCKYYTILEAENGRQGLNLAFDRIPDVIISDIMMPEMDGIELCHLVKEDDRTSHIPLILLSAKSTIGTRIAGIKTGADVYLTKPFSVQEVHAYIENLLDQRKLLWKSFELSTRDEKHSEFLAQRPMENAFLEQLSQIIEANLSDEKLNVDTLLNQATISRTHLHRKLKALTGLSATKYIINYRLDKAMNLLKSDHDGIAQIAYSVGFQSPKYFATKFKERFGKSPSEIS